MHEIKAELKQEIAKFRAELKQEIAEVKQEISALKIDMTDIK